MPPTEISTRDKLVYTAMDLFWSQGYVSTPLSSICETAEVNAGSLYYFFKTKQELLLAVLDAYLEGIEPMLLAPVWKAHSDPIDRVFGLLGVYRNNLLESDFTYGCPIGNLAIEMKDPPDEVRTRIAANFDAWIEAVRSCLERIGHEDPLGLATMVLSVMEGAVMQARTQKVVKPFDDSVEGLRDYLVRMPQQKMKRGE